MSVVPAKRINQQSHWVDKPLNPLANSEMVKNILAVSSLTTAADVRTLHFISETQIPAHWEPKTLCIAPDADSYSLVQKAWTSLRNPLRDQVGEVLLPPSVIGYRGKNTACTIEELHYDEQRAAPQFQAACEEIAANGKGKAHFGAEKKNITKTKESILSKVERMHAESGCTEAEAIAQIDDGVRGTISFRNASELKKGVAEFMAHAAKHGWKVECSNLWKNEDDYGGYIDIDVRVAIPLPNGKSVVAELQLHLDDFYDGTPHSMVSRAHKIYELMRMIPVKGSADVNLSFKELNETSRLFFTSALFHALRN